MSTVSTAARSRVADGPKTWPGRTSVERQRQQAAAYGADEAQVPGHRGGDVAGADHDVEVLPHPEDVEGDVERAGARARSADVIGGSPPARRLASGGICGPEAKVRAQGVSSSSSNVKVTVDEYAAEGPQT